MKFSEQKKLFLKKYFESIKSVAVNNFSDSSVHAFSNVFRTKNKFLKLIWLVLFLISCAVCAFLCVVAVEDYLAFEVATTIRVNKKIPLSFPAVTICQSTVFDTEYSNEFVKKIIKNLNLSLHLRQGDTSVAELYDRIDYLNFAFNIYSKLPDVTDSEFFAFGNDLESILLSCRIAGKKCSAADFVRSRNPVFGNCFIFNSAKNKRNYLIYRSGPNFGLRLELFFQVYENLDENVIDKASGFYVFIHDSDSLHFIYPRVTASVGFQTNVYLRKETVKQLPSPFSGCIENPDNPEAIYDHLIANIMSTKLNISYNQQACFSLCQSYFKANLCGCDDYKFGQVFDSIPPCLSTTHLNCVSYCEEREQDIHTKCVAYCPDACQQVSYDFFSTSVLPYPSESYARQLSRNRQIKSLLASNSTNLERLKENIAAVNVFFPRLEETEIEESESIGKLTLISNLGGILGLFLGMSFLSFFEFLEVLIEIFFLFFDLRRQFNKICWVSK